MKLRHGTVSIPASGAWLDARLAHAPDVRGLVVQASIFLPPTSSLQSSMLASATHAAGFATLGVSLFDHREIERDEDLEFNIPRLGERLLATLRWLEHQPGLSRLPFVLLANHTVCAAAIRVAGNSVAGLRALIARDGRADLAGKQPLQSLRTPCLFITAADSAAQRLLAPAYAQLQGAPHQWLRLPSSAAAHDAERHYVAACMNWLEQHLPPSEQEAPDAAAGQLSATRA